MFTKKRIFILKLLEMILFFILVPTLAFSFTPPVELSVDLPVQTHEYYVDLDAGGGGNGSEENPWNSLSDADGNVSTPAWIYVKGTSTATTTWSQNGSSGNEIVITAWGANTATIGYTRFNGGYIIVDGKSFSNPQIIFDANTLSSDTQAIRMSGAHVTLWRCEIRKGWSTLRIYQHSNYGHVYNCKIHGNGGGHLVYLRDGDYVEVSNNIIYDSTRNGVQTNPHDSGDLVRDAVISGNIIYDCDDSGFTVLSGTGDGGEIDGLQIFNNIVWDCADNCYRNTGGENYAGIISGVEVYNNTFYGDVENAHGAGGKPATTYFRNNIVTGAITHGSGCSFIESSNNLTSSPGFVSTDENNEHFLKLSSTSTNAIDQGANTGVSDDYFGNSRPKYGGYDIGAYEYGVEAPQNLRIISIE